MTKKTQKKRTFPGFTRCLQSEDEEGGGAMANDVGDAAEARLAGVPPSQHEFDCARQHPPLLISSKHLFLYTVIVPTTILASNPLFSCLTLRVLVAFFNLRIA